MVFKNVFEFCLLLSAFTSCHVDDYLNVDEEPLLVVEGWAEAGLPPLVYLTTTVPVQVGFQQLDLNQHLLSYATVRVSDGQDTVFLTGRVHRGHRIPFEYTTGRMICQPGRSYTLMVDYESYHAEATAYVPEPCSLDSLSVQRTSDGQYQIVAYPTADASLQWGRCFLKTPDTYGDYLLAPLSLLPASRLTLQMPELQGQQDYALQPGDEVSIRCTRLDSVGHRFWTDYEQSLSLSRNFLMPLTDNLYSNVDGALGYWLGYGSTYYSVVVE